MDPHTAHTAEPDGVYRALFDLAGDAIYLLDPPSGAVLDVNRKACEMHGYAREELRRIGVEALAAVMAPYAYDEAIASFHDASCATPRRVEWLSRHASGRVFWQEVALQRVCIGGRDLVLASARDITERKSAEEALRAGHEALEQRVAERTAALSASEQSYRVLIDSITELVYIQDLDGRFVNVNEAVVRAYGYSREEIIGRTPEILADPERVDVEATMQAFCRAVEGEPQRFDWWGRRKDGSTFPKDVVLTRGTYFGRDVVIAVARDNTERKAAQDALLAVKEQQEALLNNLPDLAWLKDANHRILAVNEAVAQAAGHPRDQFAGRTDFDMWAPEVAAKIREDDERVLAAGTQVLTQEAYIHPDGTRRWLETIKRPFYDHQGRIAGTVGVARDITPRKQAEEDLRLAKEEAERANVAKSEFLSRMSHELRTPMNSILGFAQLLARRNLPADQQRNVEHILKAGRHLLNLINEVLDIARIEANRQQFSLEPVQVGLALREALGLIRPVAAQYDCRIEELASAPEEYVLADRQRLTQVLLNLLSNAVKYNRPGGKVWVTCEAAGERVRVGVHDTGRGIAPEKRDLLFVPFARLGVEQSGIEGTGLGLALSLRLVEAMGGSLRVESTPGEGSTFWIELPLTRSPLARLEGSGAVGRLPAPGAVARAPRTILYIEDNLANWSLVETIFSAQPEIQLLPALQGRLGLELAREHVPDLILLDVHLPDISGETVLRELRADPRTRSIPVLVISADATARQIDRLRAAGAQSYLTKPLDVDQFLATVDSLLSPPPLPTVP